MIRYYIMPIEEYVSPTGQDYHGPKYLKWRWDPDGMDCQWSMKHYGMINAALVAAVVTQEQHEQLVAEPDVAAAPEDIDETISAIALPKVVNVMEALRIPANWIDSTYTYRDILRMIGGLFMFAQRHKGLHQEELIDNTAQLDLRWNQIPLERRQRIIATADDMGYDYSEITNQWTVRRILKYLGDQWADTPITFGNITTL